MNKLINTTGQNIMCKFFIILIFILSTQIVNASELLSFRCKFTDGQSTTFDTGSPNSKRDVFPELIFDSIDAKKMSARLIGNAGAVDISVMTGQDSLHLIEKTLTGNLSIATIFTHASFGDSNAYPIVLSRHMAFSSMPLTSQYRGMCKMLN
jgi:hypothetical protein